MAFSKETLTAIQTSFVGGEVSPSLFGRTDLAKYHIGLSTMRNFFPNYRGGSSSRAGLKYVGMCKQAAPNLGGTMTQYPPRDINFQFSINQGFALEFGDQYMRIKSNGAYVVESSKVVTSVSIVGLFTTSTNHGYSIGDWVFDQGNTGFNGLTWIVASTPSATTFTVTDLFGIPITSATLSGAGTVARIYTVVAPYAAVDLPYLKFTQSANTMSLCCVNQETNFEYPTYDLVRNSNTNWVFTQVSFASTISAPLNVTSVAQSSTTLSTWYSYVVTAIDSVTGEESVASLATNVENNDISVFAGSNTITWSSVVGASSYNIYKATPSYSVIVPIGSSYGYAGTAFGTSFTDTNIIADFTTVPPVHNDPFARGSISSVTVTNGGAGFTQSSIGYTITTSTGSGFVGTPIVVGGSFVAFLIQNGGKNYAPADTITITGGNAGGFAAGSYTFTTNPTNGQTIILNGVTWTFTSGAPATGFSKIGTTLALTLASLSGDLGVSTNVALNVASYSVSGSVLNITYNTAGVGGNAYTLAAGTYGGTVSGATLTGGGSASASATLNVGPETGTYPGVVSYYQQRRVYGFTLNSPDSYFFSQPGAYKNMDSSIPTIDSDAFTGNPWAQQVNGIQFMQPMTNGIIILTGNGAWNLNGGDKSAITPSDQSANSQAYNGSNPKVPPIVINYDILYVQSKGSIVRDLSYNFYVNIFTGTDTTVLSNHLFNYHQIIQWAYAEEPYKLVWAIRDDGVMLSLTYLKEQEVIAWSHHDTNGSFVGVCSVTEPPVDAIYGITKRYIRGNWVYYSERMDNRNWENAEDCFCVDAGLSYPMSYPNAILNPTAANGTSNISFVSVIYGGSGYTNPIINAIDPEGGGTGATFSATLSGGVITAINVLTQGQNYNPGTTSITITDPTGSGAIAQADITNNIIFNTDVSVFNSGMVGNVIRIGNNNAAVNTSAGVTENGGGKAVITSYTSPTQVIANVIEPITAIIPNDPNMMPTPAISGQWSLSVPTQIVTGLNHLEGMQVSILADGSVVESQIVTDGSVTLPQAYSAITIGLPFICQMQTLYIDPPASETVQGKRKNITSATIRVDGSRGFSVGSNQPDQSTQPNNASVPWTGMVQVKERNALINAGNAIPLYTGDAYFNLDGGWSRYGQVAIETQNPLPLNCTAIVYDYLLGDDG